MFLITFSGLFRLRLTLRCSFVLSVWVALTTVLLVSLAGVIFFCIICWCLLRRNFYLFRVKGKSTSSASAVEQYTWELWTNNGDWFKPCGYWWYITAAIVFNDYLYSFWVVMCIIWGNELVNILYYLASRWLLIIRVFQIGELKRLLPLKNRFEQLELRNQKYSKQYEAICDSLKHSPTQLLADEIAELETVCDVISDCSM